MYLVTILSLLISTISAQIPTSRCPSGQYTLVDASQRPSTRNCGTKGYLLAPSPLGPPRSANSEALCVQGCKATAGCVSYGYSARNSSCIFYNRRLIDMKYRQPATDRGTVFSNQLCYRCAPLACTNTEAVQNGGFEDGGEGLADDWQLDGIIRNANNPHDGSYALSILLSQGETASATQVLQCVNPGLEYVLTAWLNSENIGVLSMSLDGQNVFGPQMNGQDYMQVTATVTPRSPSPTLVLALKARDSGTPYLDTISMKLKTPTDDL